MKYNEYLFEKRKELDKKEEKIANIQVPQEIDLSKYDNAHNIIISNADGSKNNELEW